MGILAYRTGLARRDMAIDLGTASTRVYVGGYGIVLSEPTVLAVDPRNGEIQAVGRQAQHLLERPQDEVVAVRPVREGVVADFGLTERLLGHIIRRIQQNRWAHPQVVMCVPPDVNGIHASALGRACLSAGAREVFLMETPIAAALGAGLAVAEPAASMVLDVGAGHSTCGVISLGGIVASQSVAVGSDELNEVIVRYLKRQHNLLIGRETAEKVKRTLVSALAKPAPAYAEVIGRHTLSDAPGSALVTNTELAAALERPLAQIIKTVRDTLAQTPPELASDIVDRGMVLTGGGSLLGGLPERLRLETHMPVQLAESPSTCVAIGSGRWLEEIEVADGSRSGGGRGIPVGRALAMR
jgi:rod shape-determining protein MreB